MREVGAAPGFLEAAPVQARQPAQIERADRADADGRRLRLRRHVSAAPPTARRPRQACVRRPDIDGPQRRAGPGRRTAREPTPRGPRKIPGIGPASSTRDRRIDLRSQGRRSVADQEARREDVPSANSPPEPEPAPSSGSASARTAARTPRRAVHRGRPRSAPRRARPAGRRLGQDLQRAEAERATAQRQDERPCHGDAGADAREIAGAQGHRDQLDVTPRPAGLGQHLGQQRQDALGMAALSCS